MPGIGRAFPAQVPRFGITPGITAGNSIDFVNLPAGATNWFNPWGPKRPVRDWVWSCSPALIPAGGDTANLPAGIAGQFNPWGRKQPVRDWAWFNAALFAPAPFTLTAADGSYTLTGSAANLALGHAAAAGSYALTGSAAALALGHVTGAGSYNATGSAAVLALGHVAGAGSYALTGSAAGLVIPGGITASAGSYALTGSAATVGAGAVDYVPGWTKWFNPWGPQRGREYWIWSVAYFDAGGAVTLTAGAGSYALTGTSIGLPGTLAAGAGSYSLTGATAALTVSGAVTYLPAGMTGSYVPWGRPPRQDWIWSVAYTTAPGGATLSAGAGSYALSGSAAALTATTFQYIHRPPLITRILPRPPRQDWIWSVGYLAQGGVVAASGNYTLTGSAASLAFRLTANAGSYTLTGSAAAPLIVLPAAAGSYALTGSAAGWALTLTAGAGSYTLTGTAAAPASGFPAGAGAYALTGADAVFVGGGTGAVLTAAVGSYAITGTAAVLSTAFPFSAVSGSYALTGTAANLATPGFFTAGPGAYELTGSIAQLIQAGTIVLPAAAGSYTLTGSAAALTETVTPPEVVLPPSGGVGRGGRPLYKRLKLKKKRKREECEELLEYLAGLPPAKAQEICEALPAERLSLLAGLTLPHGIVLPPTLRDDEDEDEIALLLGIL